MRQRLVLSSDRDHDGRADRGDGVRVVVVVTNSGQVALRSVHVTDSLVRRLGSSVTCVTTTLAPGASTICRSGSVRVRRAQAKAGVLTNHARATARTASGALVRSPVTTATLQVQKPSPEHKHKKHKKHKNKKWQQNKHKNKKWQQNKHKIKHWQPKAKKPTAKLALSQFVLKISDKNRNGRLEAGDSLRFGFQVTNSGSLSVGDLHIVGRRLTRFKVPVTCPSTELAAGVSTVCTSGPMPVTRFQVKKKRLGKNFAYAAGTTTAGTAVRSNSTVVELGRPTAKLTKLPNTGSSMTSTQLGTAAMLLVGGAFLLVLGGRRRRTAMPRSAPNHR